MVKTMASGGRLPEFESDLVTFEMYNLEYVT